MSKKLYKNKKSGVFLGVCSGVSDMLNVDVSLIRMFMLIILFFSGYGWLLYLALGIVLPDKREVPESERAYFPLMDNKHKKLYRSTTDKQIWGVCGGLGELLDIDASIVRIVFLMLAMTGWGVFWYVILAIVLPKDVAVEKIEGMGEVD